MSVLPSALNLAARPINWDADYPVICSWWKSHPDWHGDPIPRVALPRAGFVVDVNGRPGYAAFVYETDSAICHFEWFIRDPAVQADGALPLLIAQMKAHAGERGFLIAYANVKNDSLIRSLERSGFEPQEVKSMTGMICQLGR